MPINFLRRTQLLIDPDVQVRLSVRLAFCLLGYVLLFCLISLGEPLLVLLGVLNSDLSPVVARQILIQFSSTILAPLLFAIACMVLHGVIILHRLAGPVFRVRKALNAITARDLTDQIHLRERDYLSSLAEAYNVGTMQLREDMEQVRSELDDALTGNLGEGPRARLERASTILRGYQLQEAGSRTVRESMPAASVDEPRGVRKGG